MCSCKSTYYNLVRDFPGIVDISKNDKNNTLDESYIQFHLQHKEQVNLGSYYTKPELVKTVYNLLQKHINDFNNYTILDTSCGYGSFLKYDVPNRKIGADIDKIALNNVNMDVNLFNHNSLLKITRF
jgi:predicted RNA methylase